ncbi:MAG: RNA methyltransferase [Paludibacteraceae bacterium]|nr:RNA methyltransferase [Paludibacteraceae bacterium]
MYISKAKLKDLAKYKQKKYRDEDDVFVAEGEKLVDDLLSYFVCRTLVVSERWKDVFQAKCPILLATEDDLRRLSLQKSPQGVFAVFERSRRPQLFVPQTGLYLALDGVQDPGNLGTIIRLADWFGVDGLVCSESCADAYNPKVVQSTMGALSRVKFYEKVNLPQWLSKVSDFLPVYGTVLDGNNLYAEELNSNAVIVMGSEGNGISSEVMSTLSHRLFIPNYPLEKQTSESLNVAVATAIVCAEFRRRIE